MASIKLYFDTRAPRKDGSCPIKNNKIISLTLLYKFDQKKIDRAIRQVIEAVKYSTN